MVRKCSQDLVVKTVVVKSKRTEENCMHYIGSELGKHTLIKGEEVLSAGTHNGRRDFHKKSIVSPVSYTHLDVYKRQMESTMMYCWIN